MIKFDFAKDFPIDYEAPLNILSIDPRCDDINNVNNKLKSEYFQYFAETYLHAGDVLFRDYYQFLHNNEKTDEMPDYEINMFGVIYRLYSHALEMKLKSLIFAVDENVKANHNYSDLVLIIQEKYKFTGKTDSGYVKWINSLGANSKGSQTGRYPVDNKDKIIGKLSKNETVYINGIANMVFHIHELFEDYFPHLEIK